MWTRRQGARNETGIYPPFFLFRVLRSIRVFGAAFACLYERVSAVFEQLDVKSGTAASVARGSVGVRGGRHRFGSGEEREERQQ